MSRTKIEGVGLGLRFALLDDLLERGPSALPSLRFLECHPENYMRRGGRFPAGLDACRAHWSFVTHGLAMSLGGVDPLDATYLGTLDRFLRTLDVPWHSDHLCFSIAHGAASHDLLPIPFNEETVHHFARRIRHAQDALQTPLAVENISYYVLPERSDLGEGEFVRAVVDEAGCSLMLDVNNVYVNAQNHGQDPRAILAAMPLDRVVQIHVAGHFYEEPPSPELPRGFIIDTHSEPVRDEVYELLAWTLERTGRVPVLLERDDDFPTFDELYAEVERLDAIWQAAPPKGRASR
jgi:uncharacterized protein (UPF0276 family)